MLADKLISLHIKDSPFKLPSYDYDQLQKGITCQNATHFQFLSKERNAFVKNAGTKK